MDRKEKILIMNEKWSTEHLARHIIQSMGDLKTFNMVDVKDVLHKYTNWKEKMPRVEPFYAVKSNYNKVVLELLAALGVGFDCASKYEFDLVLSTGISSKKIIFAHTTKPETHITYAKEKNIDLLTFDNEFELIKIKHYYPEARLILRIKNDALAARFILGQKFGCCPQTEAFNLLLLAKKLELNVVGISFHVGSDCEEFEAYKRGISIAYDIMNKAKYIGYNMNIVDIGGGFPGDIDTSIDKAASIINQALDKYFPEGSGVKIIAEPGRYFVASASTLACCVHSARKITLPNEKSHIMYFMDNGLYGSFCNLKAKKLIIHPLEMENHSSTNCSLWGPTCDSADMIVNDIILPKLPLPSWLLFPSFGAYTSTRCTNFNGFAKPDDFVYADEHIWDLLQQLEELKFNEKIVKVKLPEEPPNHLQIERPNYSMLYMSPLKNMHHSIDEQKTPQTSRNKAFQERLNAHSPLCKPSPIKTNNFLASLNSPKKINFY